MKTENFFTGPLCNLNSARSQSRLQHHQSGSQLLHSSLLQSDHLRRQQQQHTSCGFSDKDSLCSAGSARGKRNRTRNISMRSSKGITKKTKTMDYTNYAYNEAVGRLKLMLADSYATPKGSSSYLRNLNEDSGDNFSDNMSVIDRPVFTDISKYLSPSQKSRMGSYRPKKTFSAFSSSKENLAAPTQYQPTTATAAAPLDYFVPPPKTQLPTDSVQAPVEIFNFIEKQEDYIEQLEKESKYCRNELSNLLGKVKDVINENEQLTENARSELAAMGGGSGDKHHAISPSSDSDDNLYGLKKPTTPRKKEPAVKSPRYASAPNIVYEARISELEAELMQANIDLKRLKVENEELKRKVANSDPLAGLTSGSGSVNCETHRKQIEHLQMDKSALEETIRQLHKSLDNAKSEQYSVSSKRYINDLMQSERSQCELEVKHLRDELDRQHERVRELQHEMARRIADERANAERRYNNQVDQLGGDLSSQWEQVAKLQLDLERQKRYETDMKRDLSNRNSQIDELKMELRSNRSTFLADMAQVNAEKQSLEQEITALRLQLDRGARESKTEAARLNAEINSLRQRLDRGDADILHSKREVLRLNDDISNLEKELAYGELKNEIRPTKKDLDKRISEMQEKHATTKETTIQAKPQQSQQMAATTPTTITAPIATTATIPISATTRTTTETTTTPPFVVTATTTTPTLTTSGNENACTSPIDDILRNIKKSNERLQNELAKIPPLPKMAAFSRHRTYPSASYLLTPRSVAGDSKSKCHCPRSKAFSSVSLNKDQCECCPLYSNSTNRFRPFCRSKYQTISTPYLQTAFNTIKDPNPPTITNTNTLQIPITTATTMHKKDQRELEQHHDYQHQHHHHYHELTLDTHPKTFSAYTNPIRDCHQQQSCTSRATAKVETTTDIYNNTSPSTQHCTKCTRKTTTKASSSSCHDDGRSKTEPLPWLQQHLVLNQTFSGFPESNTSCSECQKPCPLQLTEEEPTGSTTTTATTTTTDLLSCKGSGRKATSLQHASCYPALKPQTYFEELLRRDECCEKRSAECTKVCQTIPIRCAKRERPPVKVDVNVRLVPKSKTKSKIQSEDNAKVREPKETDLNLEDVVVEDDNEAAAGQS